ncbi:MAG: hypothetical protein RSG52_14935 [Terrisporobacter sp.]|uniref:hypothetical protein n=1 Tax=Terrisporobacter sp. TaxID=1965305 RepID=UPI002FC96E65
MIIFNVMIIVLLVFAIILLSGVKIMFNCKYFQLLISILVMYAPIVSFKKGYELGEIGRSDEIMLIIVCLILIGLIIWGYRRNKSIYSIHNVKQKDVMNIIEKYLLRKNIKHEIRDEEIYFPDGNNVVFVRGIMETSLDCREIKNEDFCEELVNEVRAGIKEIKERYFPYEGVFYIVFAVFLYWINLTFLK